MLKGIPGIHQCPAGGVTICQIKSFVQARQQQEAKSRPFTDSQSASSRSARKTTRKCP